MIDFESRLKSLKDRRQGSRERAILDSLNFSESVAALTSNVDLRKSERFETIAETNGIKYAVGAMAPVDSKSTQVSIREGERVAESVVKDLIVQNESVIYKLQGSVALDIHIKGYSDVDMLIIVKNPISVERPYVIPNYYSDSSDSRSLLQILKDVRAKSERALITNFPAANVDTSKSKCVCISGGSLSREVDIVPAVWHDSLNFQKTRSENDRGVMIFDKSNNSTPINYPFIHMKLINGRDTLFNGNLKCVTRLMKNMIADMPEQKQKKASLLSSFDLASIAYHMNYDLNILPYMRLGLVEKTRAHLQILIDNAHYRNSLKVPDETRAIFNDDKKIEGLEVLSKDFEDLALSIFKELKPLNYYYDSSAILAKSLVY